MNPNDPNDTLPRGDPISTTGNTLPHTNLSPLPPKNTATDPSRNAEATSSIKNSNKRPLPARATKTTKQNGEPLSEKKLRRLEKNRLSARECRRRKREATENLQRQINVLEGENLRLRLQLQVSYWFCVRCFCESRISSLLDFHYSVFLLSFQFLFSIQIFAIFVHLFYIQS